MANLKQQSHLNFLLSQAVTRETFVVKRVVTLGQNELYLWRSVRKGLGGEGITGKRAKREMGTGKVVKGPIEKGETIICKLKLKRISSQIMFVFDG